MAGEWVGRGDMFSLEQIEFGVLLVRISEWIVSSQSNARIVWQLPLKSVPLLKIASRCYFHFLRDRRGWELPNRTVILQSESLDGLSLMVHLPLPKHGV